MADIRKRVILDVDAGLDDYLALMFFLHAEEIGQVKIEAIVCTMGNTTVNNVCKNVVRLLEISGRTDIPVYRGVSQQLIRPSHNNKTFHGSDGFGGLQHDVDPGLSFIKKEPAAVAIAELVRNNPNEISLICSAPLTNVAITIKLNDDFINCFKEMWIMGGNHTAVGNVTATAEYNFYIDPEAAHIVFSSVKKPIFILTWEPCLLPSITYDWRFNVFGIKDNPAIQLLSRAEKSLHQELYQEEKFWVPCDAFLAAAFLYPDRVIVKKSSHNVTVELHGHETRGQMVLDHLKTKTENVIIIEEIDGKYIEQLFLQL